LLARLFDVQIELQAGLFHGEYFLRPDLLQAHRRRSYAEVPIDYWYGLRNRKHEYRNCV
jgi:hypothetical protein